MRAVEDGPAAGPQQVAHYEGELAVGVVRDLLEALAALGHLKHELLARARQIPQGLNGSGRDKARPDKPWARKSGSQVASFTWVLRPGTLRTCMAFARTSSKEPSRTCQTGF